MECHRCPKSRTWDAASPMPRRPPRLPSAQRRGSPPRRTSPGPRVRAPSSWLANKESSCALALLNDVMGLGEREATWGGQVQQARMGAGRSRDTSGAPLAASHALACRHQRVLASRAAACARAKARGCGRKARDEKRHSRAGAQAPPDQRAHARAPRTEAADNDDRSARATRAPILARTVQEWKRKGGGVAGRWVVWWHAMRVVWHIPRARAANVRRAHAPATAHFSYQIEGAPRGATGARAIKAENARRRKIAPRPRECERSIVAPPPKTLSF